MYPFVQTTQSHTIAQPVHLRNALFQTALRTHHVTRCSSPVFQPAIKPANKPVKRNIYKTHTCNRVHISNAPSSFPIPMSPLQALNQPTTDTSPIIKLNDRRWFKCFRIISALQNKIGYKVLSRLSANSQVPLCPDDYHKFEEPQLPTAKPKTRSALRAQHGKSATQLLLMHAACRARITPPPQDDHTLVDFLNEHFLYRQGTEPPRKRRTVHKSSASPRRPTGPKFQKLTARWFGGLGPSGYLSSAILTLLSRPFPSLLEQ